MQRSAEILGADKNELKLQATVVSANLYNLKPRQGFLKLSIVNRQL